MILISANLICRQCLLKINLDPTKHSGDNDFGASILHHLFCTLYLREWQTPSVEIQSLEQRIIVTLICILNYKQ